MPAEVRDVRLSLALKKNYCYYYLIMCLCGYDRHMGAKAQRCKTDPCGAEVSGSCEPPRVGAGNQTQILFKRKKCSWQQSHLSAPIFGRFMSHTVALPRAHVTVLWLRLSHTHYLGWNIQLFQHASDSRESESLETSSFHPCCLEQMQRGGEWVQWMESPSLLQLGPNR